MRRFRVQILLGVALIALSAALYLLQIRIFGAQRDTFFYLFQDLAFVPIQLLLVTVIVDQVLRLREKAAMLNKLNMVIGAFFSELGSELLDSFSRFDRNCDQVRANFIVTKDWTGRDFARVSQAARSYSYRLDSTGGDLNGLRKLLSSKRPFLLGLLQNQSLLEHETFTDLLWAVFHLMEELEARKNLEKLSPADSEHIAGDMKRSYVLLIAEWLSYMKHLKSEYPYLFSLAVRTNPFDPAASAEVR